MRIIAIIVQRHNAINGFIAGEHEVRPYTVMVPPKQYVAPMFKKTLVKRRSDTVYFSLAALCTTLSTRLGVTQLTIWSRFSPAAERNVDQGCFVFSLYERKNETHKNVSSTLPQGLSVKQVNCVTPKGIQMDFISALGNELVTSLNVYDLSRNTRFADFGFIGFKESALAIEFVAFVQADSLTEEQIVGLRDQFFQVTQTVPREFGLKPRGRNPNGLLGFVFTNGCPAQLVQFIKKQTKISHSASKGAIIVSWAIDLKARAIHTHNNPVSWLPPVVILAGTAFPGLDYVDSFVRKYREEPVSNPNERLTRLRQTLNSKVSLEELRSLCVDISIDFDNLPGEGKVAKIRELLEYCRRRGQLNILIQGINTTWPNEDWIPALKLDFPESFAQTPGVSPLPTQAVASPQPAPSPPPTPAGGNTLQSASTAPTQAGGAPFKLTGRQYQLLSEALRDAFTKAQLEQLLRFRLEKRLDDISMATNYPEIVFALIGEAERQGWTGTLIVAARDTNPSNAQLQELARQLGLVPGGTPSGKELERLVKASNGFIDIEQFRSRLGDIEGQVCQIKVPSGAGTSYGTGFLLGPSVVMTNYHVVQALIKGQANPANAVVLFDYKRLNDGQTVNPGTPYRLAKSDWLIDNSPFSAVDSLADPQGSLPAPDELDYALLRLDGAPGDEPRGGKAEPGAPLRGYIELPEQPYDFQSNPALFIVQHPQGDPLKLALDMEAVIGVNGNNTRVTYRTNTEGGSSGSPCFNVNWELVALHHSGDPNFSTDHKATYNEGIPLTAILALLKARGFDGELGV